MAAGNKSGLGGVGRTSDRQTSWILVFLQHKPRMYSVQLSSVSTCIATSNGPRVLYVCGKLVACRLTRGLMLVTIFSPGMFALLTASCSVGLEFNCAQC
jgi:hypothetical protein